MMNKKKNKKKKKRERERERERERDREWGELRKRSSHQTGIPLFRIAFPPLPPITHTSSDSAASCSFARSLASSLLPYTLLIHHI